MERLTSWNDDCVKINGHVLWDATWEDVIMMADRLARYEDADSPMMRIRPGDTVWLSQMFYTRPKKPLPGYGGRHTDRPGGRDVYRGETEIFGGSDWKDRVSFQRGGRKGFAGNGGIMMHRLTTDTPKDNFEMALNLFYVKDKEVWVRGYGKNGADISMLNLTREILSYQCPYVETDISDDDLIMMMPEWLFDDVRATEHVIGLLYQAAWVCAELREHLKQFEDNEAADGTTDV